MFQIEAEFVTFAETRKGKHRIVLRVAGEQVRWKVDGTVRKLYRKLLTTGHSVIVGGHEKRDAETAAVERKVTALRPLKAISPVVSDRSCPPACIRICAKANCWKNGGKSLWRAFESQIHEGGLSDRVRLKAVGCLGHCKSAPNLVCATDENVHQHCSLDTVPSILGATAPA